VAGGFDKTLEILAIESPVFHKCQIVSFILSVIGFPFSQSPSHPAGWLGKVTK